MLKSIAAFAAVLALSLPALAHPEPSPDTAAATYLGNAGLMVKQGETSILFDPLYPNGFDTYQMVPDDILAVLMAGTAPYDDVDAIFVSHMHPDHFSVDGVIDYMETHPQVKLFAPAQAVELMREKSAADNPIFTRVTAIALEHLDAPQVYQTPDLSIDVVRIPHAGWPGRADISNLIFRVTFADGTTVMHMGDADPAFSHFEPHSEHWARVSVETAFTPYWFLMAGDGPAILETLIKPLEAVGVHVPIKVPDNLIAVAKPYFSRPGETRPIASD